MFNFEVVVIMCALFRDIRDELRCIGRACGVDRRQDQGVAGRRVDKVARRTGCDWASVLLRKYDEIIVISARNYRSGLRKCRRC